MSRVLLTGIGGLLASHLADNLIRSGHRVYGIDNFSTGYRCNVSPEAELLELDLVKQPEEIAWAVERIEPEIVVMCAAWAHEGLSAFCPRLISENNFNATMNTLIPAIRSGVRRIVFTSSMARYGEQEPPFSEDITPKPVDVYGVSKVASEQAIKSLAKVHDFDYTIIVPHNLVGIRQNLSDPYRNVAGIFIRRALEGKNLIIYGDGEQKRSFSYVDDGVRAMEKSLWEPRASKQTINIGPTEEFTINQLADLIIKLSGNKVSKEHFPPRPLEVKNAWCTNDKAKDILGFETTVSFEEGIEKMWQWAKKLKETTGIAEPKYLDQLELVNEKTPTTWTKKLL